ncbi:hypothetical protein B296_00001506 [Ensete ventricosum]|uniref:alpha-amylase n=1 Tax=Ensete ventricosum TaxID=4639 RepID=A0A426ZSY9_ENSVE|nr:hypothetical protein B296_00001506 [Ensete ventricosum]
MSFLDSDDILLHISLAESSIGCLVKITKAERDVYAAEIDGKLAVKIGPGYYEPPNGPTKWVVAAEGKDYKVWETS